MSELFTRGRIAKINRLLPPDVQHPKEQKFKIGDKVRIVNPQSWFAKRFYGRVFTVEFSYHQQYGWMSSYNEKNVREYSLRDVETGLSSAWYSESELELVEDDFT